MRKPLCLLLVAVLCTGGGTLQALPRPDEPIDPSKRAPISTRDAIRPGATQPVGSGIVGSGKIPTKRAAVEVASKDKARAPIIVRESRAKSVTRPTERRSKVRRDFESRNVSSLPAAIPRLDGARFGKALAEYRRGKVPPSTLANLAVRVDRKSADMSEINRFANPRAALEAQGIPVTSAASGDAPAADTAPIPIKSADTAKKP